MHIRFALLIVCFCGVLGTRGLCGEARWSGFQGPLSPEVEVQELPLKWSPSENIAWKAELPGYGQSSPVGWEDRVFVTTVSGAMKEKCHICAFDLKSGEKRWQLDLEAATQAKSTNYISKAAPTPVVDDERLFVLFEGGNLVALTHGGEVRWERNLVEDYGPIASRHGLGSSLEQDQERVFVWIEREKEPYLLAVSKQTGKTVWKSAGLGATSWSSPRLIPTEFGKQLVLSGIGKLAGYDPKTGEQLWTFDEIAGNSTPTPFPLGDNRFLIGATAGRGGDEGNSARSNGVIEITRQASGEFQVEFDWRCKRATCSFGSPIVHQGLAYFVNRAGVVYCLDAKTGAEQYVQRTDSSIWATPLAAGNRVYLFGKNGVTTVLQAGEEFEVLAENALWKDDPNASQERFSGPVLYAAAVLGESLLLRRGETLYCVRAEK